MVARLLGRPIEDPLIERANKVLDNTESVRIAIVPKDARALAELRRLEGHARK